MGAAQCQVVLQRGTEAPPHGAGHARPCRGSNGIPGLALSLQDIEKRLSRPIPALAADLTLPPEIAARVAGGGGGGGSTQYGQQRGGAVSQEVMERVQVSRGCSAPLVHESQSGAATTAWHAEPTT